MSSRENEGNKKDYLLGGIGIGYALRDNTASPSDIVKKNFRRKGQFPKDLEKENSEIFDKLSNRAKNQGTNINFKKGLSTRSSYINREGDYLQNFRKSLLSNIKIHKKELSDIKKKNRSQEGLSSTDHKILKDIKRQISDDKRALNSKDSINLAERNAFTLAHELGHSEHFHNRGGSKVGKEAHKLKRGIDKLSRSINPLLGKPKHRLSNSAGLISGLSSGINAGRKEAKGEKESVISKVSPILAPLAIKTPQLVSEFEASRQGMKLLKKAGASKKYRRLAGKSLGASFGTYAAGAISPALLGYGTRQVGKEIGKRMTKDRKDDST